MTLDVLRHGQLAKSMMVSYPCPYIQASNDDSMVLTHSSRTK